MFVPKELHDLLGPPPMSGMPFNAQLDKIDLESGYQVPKPLPRPPTSDSESQQSEEHRKFLQVLERSTVHVHVPQDRQVLNKIHKTIEYCLREGPVFEAIIIARESKNPHYRFLYDQQSVEHIYYRWKLYSLLHGEDPYHWRTNPFKLFEGGPWWRPPPLNPFADGMPIELVEKLTGVNRELLASGRSAAGDLSRKMEIISEPISSAGGSELKFRGKFGEVKIKILNDLLTKLSSSRTDIGSAMLFCINHSDAAEEIINNVERAISQETTPATTKIAQLFLISDILHNSSAAVTNASFYRKGFQAKLGGIFEKLRDCQRSITDQQDADKFKQRIMSVLSSWNYFHIYESKFLVELSDILLTGSSCLELRTDDRQTFLLQANDDQDDQEKPELIEICEQLDGEAIDDETLAECLEARGLSLRWYKTLELSDEELDVPENEDGRAGSSRPARSPPTPSSSDKLEERVKFKASKWEVVNQEEEGQKSRSSRFDPIRTLTTSELLKQQMQKQEVVSSADEYESLASSDESNK